MKTIALWIADKLAQRYGFRVVHTETFNYAEREAVKLHWYTIHSGHLTRGFKAGKVLREGFDHLCAALGTAGVRQW